MRSQPRAVLVLVSVVVLFTAACSSTKSTGAGTASTSSTASSSSLEQTSDQVEAQLKAAEPPGTQHLHFSYGPIAIAPGQNAIQFSNGEVPKPTEDGYILRIEPNIRRGDGSVPPVDVIHLHHGVWLNNSAKNGNRGVPNFFAAGEEKTTMELPPGFGYKYFASDAWTINYMIHDLTPNPDSVSITYDMDFLPASAPAAASIREAWPIWMDVQNGSIYPVFDVLQGSGTNGTFTYPDQANDPYNGRRPKNVETMQRDGVLIGTGGHLHPGGLHDDLFLERAQPDGSTKDAHLFSSIVHYWEPSGAVSWDAAMTVTNPDWRVAVHKGDKLRISTTYDTTRSSWYESMGIMVTWAADGTDGADPFATPVDGNNGHLTHGHLAENDNHGGHPDNVLGDPSTFGTQPAPANGQIGIDDFTYGAGDLGVRAPVPTVKQGQTLTFTNNDAPIGVGIWHTITACKAPCNLSTGIAYPLADGPVQFDSGELGAAGPPTAGRIDYTLPSTIPPGQYTYFCRIHPFMRGAFDVAPAS